MIEQLISVGGGKKLFLLALPLPLKQRLFNYLDDPHKLSLIFLRLAHPTLRKSNTAWLPFEPTDQEVPALDR